MTSDAKRDLIDALEPARVVVNGRALVQPSGN
jgi:hypothetical protein